MWKAVLSLLLFVLRYGGCGCALKDHFLLIGGSNTLITTRHVVLSENFVLEPVIFDCWIKTCYLTLLLMALENPYQRGGEAQEIKILNVEERTLYITHKNIKIFIIFPYILALQSFTPPIFNFQYLNLGSKTQLTPWLHFSISHPVNLEIWIFNI